jgi:hypothetical protein
MNFFGKNFGFLGKNFGFFWGQEELRRRGGENLRKLIFDEIHF